MGLQRRKLDFLEERLKEAFEGTIPLKCSAMALAKAKGLFAHSLAAEIRRRFKGFPKTGG